MASLNLILLFVSLICTLCLSVFVFSAGPASKVNRSFALFTAATAGWISVITYSEYLFLQGLPRTIVSIGMGYFFGTLVPATFVHFTMYFPSRKDSLSKRRLAINYFLPALFVLAGFLGFIVERVYIIPGREYYTFERGPLYLPFLVYFIGYFAIGLLSLTRQYRHTRSSIEGMQIRYLFLGVSIAFTFGTSFSVLLPLFDHTTYSNLGPVTPLFAFSFISYAILKHRLMDIDVVIKKSVTYSALLLMLLLPCYALVIYGQKSIFGKVDPRFTALFLGLLTAAAFVFPRLKTRTEQTIEQVLFKGKYDYRDTLARFSQDLVSILQLDTLLENTLQTLVRVMEITKATALLYDEPQHGYRAEASVGEALDRTNRTRVPSDDPLIQTLQELPRVLVTEELERQENSPGSIAVGATLRQLNCEACIPLTTKRALVGLVLLGKKRDGGIYSTEDLKLLATLGNQAAMAIENARLYENLKRQERATQRAERLASLGTLTAGLAHEIRNPLVSVKTFLQLLPERLNDTEFRTTFLEITTSEVERITRLLSQLLEFARPAEPQLRHEDLGTVIEQMGLLVRNEAAKKQITLDWNAPEGLPKVVLDAEQIKQVLLNLLKNAVEATPEGGRVRMEVRPVRKAGTLQQVQVEVSDSGSGIPEEDLEKIFTPFFTTKDTGTGLGLAIAHRIIEDHGGTMEVTSQVGRGTTFLITLPIDPRA